MEKDEKRQRLESSVEIFKDAQAKPLNQERIERFLEQSGDVNTMDENGFTLMHYAAAYNQSNIMQLLLDNGAQVDIVSTSGFEPMHIAIHSNNPDAFQWLINNGGNIEAIGPLTDLIAPISLAVKRGHAQIVDLLLNKGASPETLIYDSENYQYMQLLHCAARNDHPEIVEILLMRDINVNARADGDSTALHHAAKNQHNQMVRFLLEHGADVNALDAVEKRAIDWAILNRDIATLSVLLEHRANPSNIPSEFKSVNTFILLTEGGIDPNIMFPGLLEKLKDLMEGMVESSKMPDSLDISIKDNLLSFTLANLLILLFEIKVLIW